MVFSCRSVAVPKGVNERICRLLLEIVFAAVRPDVKRNWFSIFVVAVYQYLVIATAVPLHLTKFDPKFGSFQRNTHFLGQIRVEFET